MCLDGWSGFFFVFLVFLFYFVFCVCGGFFGGLFFVEEFLLKAFGENLTSPNL